jgi:hypothetical protein
MALVDGMNIEGKIRKRNTDNIFHHPSGMEFLENIEPRRPKKGKKYNFDNILGKCKGFNDWEW